MKTNVFRRLIQITLFAGVVCLPAYAQAPTAQQQEFNTALAAANAATQAGPRDVALRDQAVLKLPAGYGFIPKAESAALMKAMGNGVGEDDLGLIVGDSLDGFVSLRFEPSGYVKDDDAKNWDADALLKNLKEGTEAMNEARRTRALPEVEVTGWVEKPAYDSATHRLVWSAALKDKTAAPQDDQGVNYNTYMLGREGYLSLNLVTNMSAIEAGKPQAHNLLGAVDFNQGKQYADFDASTDHVAEYGLAALVGGIAAKKLGLLATIGIFLAKFWKIGALAVVGFGAAVRKYFSNKA